MSTAPAASSGRYCSSPVRFSPVATEARTASSDRGQAFGVPPAHRLLHPGEVEGALQFADMADGLLAAPRLVRVEHQTRPHSVTGLGQHVPDQGQSVPVPLDVEAALELGRPQAPVGVGLVRRRPARRRSGRCRDRRHRRAPSGRVRPSSRHSGSPAALALMSHSAVSSAPMVPKTVPACPALKVCRSMRSYRAVTQRGSSPSIAAKIASSSDVRSQPDARDPLVGVDEDDRHGGDSRRRRRRWRRRRARPHSWTVVRVRNPVIRMSAFRGTGGDRRRRSGAGRTGRSPGRVPRR